MRRPAHTRREGRHRLLRRLLAVGLSSLAAGAAFASIAAAEGYDPYKVSREKFRADVKTIALRPLRLQLEDVDGEALARDMLERVASALRSKGYVVIDAVEFDRRWRDYAESLGGVYDTQTGVADPEIHRLAFEYTARDLSTELDVDATLRPNLFTRVVSVGWSSSGLRAVGEPLIWKGETIDFVEGLGNWPQIVSAIWVGVEISDLEGVELYDVGCAVKWNAIYMARGSELRPQAEVYESGGILDGVDRCLEDLEAR